MHQTRSVLAGRATIVTTVDHQTTDTQTRFTQMCSTVLLTGIKDVQTQSQSQCMTGIGLAIVDAVASIGRGVSMTDEEYDSKVIEMVNTPPGFVLPRVMCKALHEPYGTKMELPEGVIPTATPMMRELDIDLEAEDARAEVRDFLVVTLLTGIAAIVSCVLPKQPSDN